HFCPWLIRLLSSRETAGPIACVSDYCRQSSPSMHGNLNSDPWCTWQTPNTTVMTIKRPPAALKAEVHATYHAAKRPRQNTSSLFENLPTEILQQIFFAGLNGNLLKASPRIAVKLSGSQNIYRTSFFIAFYHHQILELRKEFRFEYLVPYIEVPVPAWELR